MNAKWLDSVIAEGLQKLVALSLPGTPPAETITVTLDVWLDILHGEFNSPHRDKPRIEAAFRRMIKELERWPPPKMLLFYLSEIKPPSTTAITQELTDEQRTESRKRVAEAMAQGLKRMPDHILERKDLAYGQERARQYLKQNQKGK